MGLKSQIVILITEIIKMKSIELLPVDRMPRHKNHSRLEQNYFRLVEGEKKE